MNFKLNIKKLVIELNFTMSFIYKFIS